MKDQDLYSIWLTGIPSVGPVAQKKLWEYFKSPERIYEAKKWELNMTPGVGPTLAARIWEARSLDHAQRIMDRMDKEGIHLLTYEDPLYPEEVKQIPKAPSVLYYLGHLEKRSRGIGIIGARQCTPYGKQVTVETAEFLARHHIPVISGMAKGIDGYAHKACLKAGGYTLAFLGSGVDVCYPKEHQSLRDKIIDQGAILSSYPPGTPVHPCHFYQRNFILSAWSSKLLVVEAGESSGTIATVNAAKKIKREVWAVPNGIYCKESMATNQLIAEGASIFLHPQQLAGSSSDHPFQDTIYDELSKIESLPFISMDHSQTSLSSFEKRIMEKLKTSPHTIDQLAQFMNKNHAEVIQSLSLLELEGIINVKPNHMVELT